jgi:hypothetical protein
VVLPRVAELCRWLGEEAWAEEAEQWAGELRRALREAWNGHWFDRILTPAQPVGREELFLDCQPWVILAGAASEAQRFILLHEVRERLAAHLPHLPPKYPALTSEGEPLADGLCGGVSFETNGPLIWALAQADPAAAWEMLKACTLASHAEASGERWFGIWSGPDSLDPAAERGPEPVWQRFRLPFLGGRASAGLDFPIASGHSANQLLFAVAHLAGLEPDARGYRVQPRFPFPRFSFEAARLGLTCREGSVSGYIVPQGNDAVLMRVDLPEGLVGRLRVLVDRHPIPAEVSRDGRQVSFDVFVRGGLRTEWEVAVIPEDEE